MAEPATSTSHARIWLLRAGYAAVILALFLLRLMPLETTPHRIAGPELALALTCAWAIRRPELVPAPLVALLFLLGDLLLHRPPGLMALIVMLTMEWLKGRSHGLRQMPFVVEWLFAGMAIAVVLVGFRLAQAIFLIDQAQLSLTMSQLVATLLAYPLVVGLSLFLAGLRKAARGEVDALGHKL